MFAAEEPLTLVSLKTVGGCSWLLPLIATAEFAEVDCNGNEAPREAFFSSVVRTEGLLWSTFKAVVDSDIAPVLGLAFALAWIPVYSLNENDEAVLSHAQGGKHTKQIWKRGSGKNKEEQSDLKTSLCKHQTQELP